MFIHVLLIYEASLALGPGAANFGPLSLTNPAQTPDPRFLGLLHIISVMVFETTVCGLLKMVSGIPAMTV